MLYMVEMELPDRSREAQWHDWYVAHIRKLLTLDGYFASQRFEALTPRAAPFLAIHDVVGPEFPMYGCSNCDEDFKVTLAGIKL